MVVDAVMLLDELLPLNMIGIKKVQGGSLEVSVQGGLFGGLCPGGALWRLVSRGGSLEVSVKVGSLEVSVQWGLFGG